MAARDLINLGLAPDSGTGDSARRGGEKINNLFSDVYSTFGDNPIGNDPNGNFYGYRRSFVETEYKVGELHSAQKYAVVGFEDAAGTPFDATNGYGTSAADAQLVDNDNDNIPDIYRDGNWYFLSRGETITADLSNVSQGGSVNLVLPLASIGDTVKVRDTLGTWGNARTLYLWTTPYEFVSDTQVDEWVANTPNTTVNPPPEAASITLGTDTYIAPFKRPINGTSDADLDLAFTTGTGNNSQVGFVNRQNFELTFIYRGPAAGWVVEQSLFVALTGSIDVLQDNYEEADWIQIPTGLSSINFNGDSEFEISAGQWILPIAPLIGNVPSNIVSTSVPVVKNFRLIENGRASLDSEIFRNRLVPFLTDLLSTANAAPTNQERVDRLTAILGADAAGNVIGSGFQQDTSGAIHKEVAVASITDTTGNIILISSEPFDGFTQILIPR